MEGDALSRPFLADWAGRVIALLSEQHDYLEMKRQAMMRMARERFDLGRIATQWERVLTGGKA